MSQLHGIVITSSGSNQHAQLGQYFVLHCEPWKPWGSYEHECELAHKLDCIRELRCNHDCENRC